MDPILRALGASDARARRARGVAPDTETTAGGGAALVCGACGHTVTSRRHEVRVNDAHQHRFMNPAGYLFHLACFAEAPGCQVVGPPSDEYPWFPGFAWRYGLCAACHAHLGWYFQNEGGQFFFGLRLDRLREAAAGSPG